MYQAKPCNVSTILIFTYALLLQEAAICYVLDRTQITHPINTLLHSFTPSLILSFTPSLIHLLLHFHLVLLSSLRFTHSLIHSFTQSLIHSLTHSFTPSRIHSITQTYHKDISIHHSDISKRPLVHSFTHSLSHSLIYSFTHSFYHSDISMRHIPTVYSLAHNFTCIRQSRVTSLLSLYLLTHYCFKKQQYVMYLTGPRSLIQSIHSFTPSLLHSFSHSLLHSFTYSCIFT